MDDLDQYAASNFKKPNASDDLSKYESSNYKKKKPSLLSRADKYVYDQVTRIIDPVESLGRSARDLVGGYAQGFANIPSGVYNLGASGVNALGRATGLGEPAPKAPTFDVIPKNTASSAGELLSFFGAPGILKALSKTPEMASAVQHAQKIPLIAQGLKHASNVFTKNPIKSRVAGNAVLGGAYTPENPLAGAALGAGAGVAGELIGKGYKGIKNAVKNTELFKKNYPKIDPLSKAKDIENYLSGGANNFTKNSQELVKDIRKAYEPALEQSKIFYDYALNAAGKNKIYEVPSMILNQQDKSKKTMEMIKSLNVGDLYKKFKNNPTFENAHWLQSQLGDMSRRLKGNLSKNQNDINHINDINAAQKSLKKDISNYLERFDKTASNPVSGKYKIGSELFEKNVVPYHENEKILEIVKGGKTDIKDLHKIFDTPSNLIDKSGKETLGHINKILEDLPKSSQARILFNAIGGNKLTPNQLIKKLDEVKNNGYGRYFTPELEADINELGKRLKNVKRLKTVGKIAATGASGAGILKGVNALLPSN